MIKQIDEQEFVEVFFDLFAEVECGDHFDGSNSAHVEWVRKRIAIHFFRGGLFYAYFLDEVPVGYVAVLIDRGLSGVNCVGECPEVLDIIVLQRYRRKGYGSELLKYAENVARQSGAYCIYLRTYAGNDEAIAFYVKKGYDPVAEHPDVNGPNDRGDLYMRKILG